MTNILFRYVNHFGYYPKVGILNRTRIVNLRFRRYVKSLYLMRTSEVTNKTNTKISKKLYNISAYVSAQKWIRKSGLEDVINLIQVSNDISSNEVLIMFKLCNNIVDCTPLDKVKLMESLWFNLTVCNFQLNTCHYESLLKLYVDNNYDFSPSDLLMEMKDKHIEYSPDTVYLCFAYYCMKGEINKAISLLECCFYKIPAYLGQPVLDSLLMACSQFRNITDVNNILNSMINLNIDLSANSYTALMCAHAKLNDINKIKEILKVCHSHYLYFTNANILNVIYTLAVNNHIEHINTMYQYLKTVSYISDEEVQLILKLLNINQIHIAITAFLHMILKNKWSQYTNIMHIILKYVIDKNMTSDEIMEICDYFKCNRDMYKKSLSLSLYYSLLNGGHSSLPLLRAYKHHCEIKPHFFWPLLKRKSQLYDYHGILNILQIMCNEFNIHPCIHTLTDYILPTCFEKPGDGRNLLIKYKVHKIIFDNAWVLLTLKRLKMGVAESYMQQNPGPYFYKELVHDLWCAAIFRNDVKHFVSISCMLFEDKENIKYSMPTLSNKEHKFVPVPMDTQLCDMMTEFPSQKEWLRKVVKSVAERHIELSDKTIKRINYYLSKSVTSEVAVTG